MIRWSTPFEILIPGRPTAEVSDLARTRSVRRYARGLHVRTNADRITARINEMSRSSVAPTMKGRLLQASDGSVIVGRIHWAALVLGTVISGIGAICFGAQCVLAVLRQEYGTATVWGLGALVFGTVATLLVRGQDDARDDEEQRLREELVRLFEKRR